MRVKNEKTKLSKVRHKILFLVAVVSVFTVGDIMAVSQSPGSFGQGSPDLTLASSDITFSNDQPMLYDTITIYATVHNIGNAAASNIMVRFSYEYEIGISLIGDTLIDAIDMNSSQQTQIDWFVGFPGTYEINVCIDPDNTIVEANEVNNCASHYFVVQRFYIICEDNAHTVPPGQSTTYLITIKDNQWDYCIHNFSLEINLPIFFSEWNATLSMKYFYSGGGQTTNVTLTVEVPETTQGMPSAGLTAPICVEATMMCPGEAYNETHSVCTYTTASEEVKNISATIDIDPDTLNLKSKGKWITAYIGLPSGYDVNNIDVSTVLLNGAIPAEWGDVQGTTLMVKFDRGDVENLIGAPSDKVELTVTGELFDGIKFEGSDTIRVINPP